MLCEKQISQLRCIVEDALLNKYSRENYRKKINGVLHNKSEKTVVKELAELLNSTENKSKNQSRYTAIVVIALFERNLDAFDEIKNAIIKYGLTKNLYGGLKAFFSLRSYSFRFSVVLNYSNYPNKYEYITGYDDLEYWRFAAIFRAVEMLGKTDMSLFEDLVISDRSCFWLLNMAYRLSITPSDELIGRLLQSQDDMHRNIGFNFLVFDMRWLIREIVDAKRYEENNLPFHKDPAELEIELALKTERCVSFLEKYASENAASLILNFIMVQRSNIPEAFIRLMLSKDNRWQLISEINAPIRNKINSLRDLFFLIKAICDVCGDAAEEFSTDDVYAAATERIISFLKEDRGIYSWEQDEEAYMRMICAVIPKKCRRHLQKFAQNMRKDLMCSSIDLMTRNRIYYEDKRKDNILAGISYIINKMP